VSISHQRTVGEDLRLFPLWLFGAIVALFTIAGGKAKIMTILPSGNVQFDQRVHEAMKIV
jgi:hypothetical protein